ncbi:hypothetical protein [Prevotella communis]|jgi:hypothetical protein|uniref:DUF3244 domain-containing protein n=1 Tax=Prevotella communis TaxID=2913614 RepID=A0A1H0CPU7_9BACT|nr:hypothetical protein [Prevotella communis]UKK57168.1 hypothetical protein L6476_02655 [Prevotella communis]UKK59872.1 hypothetical protein L6470_02360 [Prevotella communis]UKK67867.1 hypothetical protein L6464_00670 [Prevotella communis]UKK69997.1 hypothetical protein L6466_11810 [Prevotella communis]SDG29209.1 hypothetical protein SAMN04487901_10288 [Prevotella communis]
MGEYFLAVLGHLFLMPSGAYSQSQNLFSFENVYLHVRKVDSADSAKSVKRSSVKTPSLSLENHTLYFNTSCDGCTLQLLDESGNVKYTKVIPENTSNITLPSDMAGGCELQIIRGQYCFYGLIDL